MSNLSFEYDERGFRALMGEDLPGRLADELAAIGAKRVMIVCTPGESELAFRAADMLKGLAVEVFDKAVQHVPRHSVKRARFALEHAVADTVLAVGGGSAIGLGKALVLEVQGLKFAAIPTTYSGSEATRIWSITNDGTKSTGRATSVAPALIAYIPSWTTTLPANFASCSGVNAIAHCIDPLFCESCTPMTRMMSREGIRVLSSALQDIRQNPNDLEARGRALWGAFLGGRTLDLGALCLHHKVAHVLGGKFGLPHAQTHAAIIPYTVAYNKDHAPRAMQIVAEALRADDAVQGLWNLNKYLGIHTSLAKLGLHEEEIDLAVEEIMKAPYPNPRPMEAEPLRAMMVQATRGEMPTGW